MKSLKDYIIESASGSVVDEMEKRVENFNTGFNWLRNKVLPEIKGALSPMFKDVDIAIDRFGDNECTDCLFIEDALEKTGLSEEQIQQLTEPLKGYRITKNCGDCPIAIKAFGETGLMLPHINGRHCPEDLKKYDIPTADRYIELVKMFAQRLDEVTGTRLESAVSSEDFKHLIYMVVLKMGYYWKKRANRALVQYINQHTMKWVKIW